MPSNSHTVRDAKTKKEHTIHLSLDEHGLCITLDDSDPVIVLDMSGGKLRVFKADCESVIDEVPSIIIDPMVAVNKNSPISDEPLEMSKGVIYSP